MIFPIKMSDDIVVALAKLFWNTCEYLKIQAPFAPQLFGIIIGSKPERTK